MTTKSDYTSLYVELMPHDLRSLRDYAIKVTQELYSHQQHNAAYCHVNDRYVTPEEYNLMRRIATLNDIIEERKYTIWLMDNGIDPDYNYCTLPDEEECDLVF